MECMGGWTFAAHWSAAALASIAALRFRRFRRFVEVQLLCTNDTHSQIDPFLDPSGRRIGGVIRRAVCFDRLRDGQTVTLDAGDHLTGSAFFDFFQGRVEMEVLQRLGYDASAIGNHDFDGNLIFVPEALRQAPGGFGSGRGGSGEGEGEAAVGDTGGGLAHFKTIAAAYAPATRMLCGNLMDSSPSSPSSPFPAWTVFHRGGVKIGVASVIGPQAFSVVPLNLRVDVEYVALSTER